jgi:hypothetical protein
MALWRYNIGNSDAEEIEATAALLGMKTDHLGD